MSYGFHMRTQADGEAIRRLREEKGLTFDGLALLSGVSKAHVWRLENETRLGSATTRKKLADALGVAVADISKPVPRQRQAV